MAIYAFITKLLPWQNLATPTFFEDATVKPSISANQSDASFEARSKMAAPGKLRNVQ